MNEQDKIDFIMIGIFIGVMIGIAIGFLALI